MIIKMIMKKERWKKKEDWRKINDDRERDWNGRSEEVKLRDKVEKGDIVFKKLIERFKSKDNKEGIGKWKKIDEDEEGKNGEIGKEWNICDIGLDLGEERRSEDMWRWGRKVEMKEEKEMILLRKEEGRKNSVEEIGEREKKGKKKDREEGNEKKKKKDMGIEVDDILDEGGKIVNSEEIKDIIEELMRIKE